jgi:Excalibur calcium-binding domain
MLIVAILIATTPLEQPVSTVNPATLELSYAKKRGKSPTGASGRKFGSCAIARKAGYSHMRRGQKGYSANLDRDGDGVACDKVK